MWGDGYSNGSVNIQDATSDSTGSAYAQIWGPVQVDRTGVGAVPGSHYCGSGSVDPCGTYAGPPTQFNFTRLDADLSLTADSTTVGPGSTVKFTYGASPASVAGKVMGIYLEKANWVPDANAPDQGGEPTETPEEGSWMCDEPTKTCTRRIVGSGTFTLTTFVNGKHIAKSVHIQTPTLTMKAVKKTGAVGRNVVFTPVWSDGVPAQAQGSDWHWIADTLPPGQTGSCSYDAMPCTRAVQENGTMTVRIFRGNVARTTRVHVTVVPCATNDSILDDPIVRNGLMDMWNQSNASTFGQQREIAGLILDSAGTKRVLIKSFDPFSDGGCSIGSEDFFTQTLPLGWSRVAGVHTHPATHYQKVICSPGDTVRYDAKKFGSPSPADWNTSKKFGQTMNMPNAYVVDSNSVTWYNGAPVAFHLDTIGTKIRQVPNSYGTQGWHSGWTQYNRQVGSCRRA